MVVQNMTLVQEGMRRFFIQRTSDRKHAKIDYKVNLSVSSDKIAKAS